MRQRPRPKVGGPLGAGADPFGEASEERSAEIGASSGEAADYDDVTARDGPAPRDAAASPDGQADAAECERRAVALLARREHSRLELERKLAGRGFPKPLIVEALDALEQNGLLSGQRFIDSFIAARAARGSGPSKIRAELVQRGIRPDEASAALRSADEDWGALARRARIKRFGAAAPCDFAERARQARFLHARGFDPEQIDAALEVGVDSD